MKGRILYDSAQREVPGAVGFIETGSRMVVSRGWGEGRIGSCLMGIEFQFCKDEKSSRDKCTM